MSGSRASSRSCRTPSPRSASTTCAARRSRWAGPRQITVIDIDQGHSGASAADREGFQQLVAEVSLGRAGIVLGLECSRLARNSADWHQLLELCGMTGTLICDEDGLYDPRNFNDRLLLGMKGQMPEALSGIRHKASYADIAVMPTTSCEDAAGLAGVVGMSA